jgi:hypothetical protein
MKPSPAQFVGARRECGHGPAHAVDYYELAVL